MEGCTTAGRSNYSSESESINSNAKQFSSADDDTVQMFLFVFCVPPPAFVSAKALGSADLFGLPRANAHEQGHSTHVAGLQLPTVAFRMVMQSKWRDTETSIIENYGVGKHENNRTKLSA